MTQLDRQLLDALPVTVYAVDLEGTLTFVNRSWARFAETNGAPQLCDEGAVIGTSIWKVISDPVIIRQMHEAMQMLREGRATSLSWEFPCNSPTEERIFLMQLTALAEHDEVCGYVFSTVDITPSHRSREALINTGMALARTLSVERVLQEVTQQLRRTMSCDMVAIGLNRHDSSLVRLVHHSGYEPSEVTHLEERLAPAWQDALDARGVIAQTRADGFEITAPITGGEGVQGAITLSSAECPPAHGLEEIRRVLATIAAETAAAVERAWLVRRLGQKRRLEAIGEVSAGVAHELRNPLFGISSAAQLLRFRMKDDLVVEKNVGRILREVDRLNSMVTSLLEYGRPNSIQLTADDPDAVWDEVLENQRGRFENRALQLDRSRARAGFTGRIDSRQLSQVFINVLMNAVDAAPDGSRITLSTAVLPNGGWQCQLHNSGAAITAEALPRVFDIFFSTKVGGTGIGLALCQRIVEEHGGAITIESAHDAGTMLTLTLPPA